MNYTTAVFLLNNQVRAVQCAYDFNPANGKPLDVYTYKTLDPSIKVGDICVVETQSRVKHTCVQVIAVDVQIPLDDNIQYKWIVSKVDLAPHAEVLEKEQAAITLIRKGEEKRKREDMIANTMAALDETSKAELKSIAFTGGSVEA